MMSGMLDSSTFCADIMQKKRKPTQYEPIYHINGMALSFFTVTNANDCIPTRHRITATHYEPALVSNRICRAE